jgi:hypothetical protein
LHLKPRSGGEILARGEWNEPLVGIGYEKSLKGRKINFEDNNLTPLPGLFFLVL